MVEIEIPVREHVEEMPVVLTVRNNRLVIKALNEAGYNCTCIDLLELIEWIANDNGLIAERQRELNG